MSVEFRPAAADTGIVFVRRDVDDSIRIPALVQSRVEAPRRTNLVHRSVRVEMVEHIMAALAGLQVDNCEVWVDRAEMPGCDGSSLAFASALQQAGVVEQHALRPCLVVTDTTRVGTEDEWVEARPNASGLLTVKYSLNYSECPAIGRQSYQGPVTSATFLRDLAPARTFVLEQEADWLRSQGLGMRVSYDDILVFGEQGPIENILRFDDECVRHKTLDLVGDLALSGCDLIGQVVAHRSGHRLNAELVRVLLTEGRIIDGTRRTA